MTTRQPLPPDMFDELCPSSLVPFRFGDKWAALVIRCLEPLEVACAWAAEHWDELLDAWEQNEGS